MSTDTTTKSATSSAGVPSIISADLQITGNLKSAGDIQVDGVVEGDITSKSLTVGEGAKVKGAISADTVRICGSVQGSVRSASVVLAKSARIDGDIMHDSLAVEAGAYIEGNIKRLSGSASASGSAGTAASTAPTGGAGTGPAGGSGTGSGASPGGSAAGASSGEQKKSFGS